MLSRQTMADRYDSAVPMFEALESRLLLDAGPLASLVPDLTRAVAFVSLPTTVPTGTWGYAVVTATNGGTAASTGLGSIELWATSGVDNDVSDDVGTTDRLLGTSTNQWLGLGVGQTGAYVVTFTLPGNMANASYKLVSVVDSADDVSEGNESNNNSALTAQAYAIAAPFVDLTATLASTGFSGVSGVLGDLARDVTGGDVGLASITITNAGNTLAAGWMTTQVWASGDGDLTQGLGGADDFQLGSTRSYVYLTPGASTTWYVWCTIPDAMPVGTYSSVVVVDSTDDIAESTAGELNNNSVAAGTYVMDNPDLTVAITSNGLTGNLTRGDGGIVHLTVTNGGTELASGLMTIQVWASGDGDLTGVGGAVGDANDYLLNQTVLYAYIAAGQIAHYYLWCVLSSITPAGTDYNLIAAVDSGGDVHETSDANNTAMAAGAFSVLDPDLTAQVLYTTLGTAVSVGSGLHYAIIQATNAGAVRAVGTYDFQLWATSGGDNDVTDDVGVTDRLLYTFNDIPFYLLPGQTMPYGLLFNLPGDMDAEDYQLVAVIDSSDDVAETSNANNASALFATVHTVTGNLPDLTGTIGTSTLPDPAIETDTGTVDVQITNSGGVAATGTIDIILWGSLDGNLLAGGPAGGADDFQLGSALAEAINLAPGASTTVQIAATIPAGMAEGFYDIIAVIERV